MVDFNGWLMPIHYGSQIKEHQTVRNSCGVFDVSHMTILDIEGSEINTFLRTLLSNDIALLEEDFSSMYSAMLNELGGVIDDLIVYKMPFGYRLVVNCATRESDIVWIKKQSENKKIKIIERNDLSMIAIQGPSAIKVASKCLQSVLVDNLVRKKTFKGSTNQEMLVTTTGYTGERGIEIMLSHKKAKSLWAKVLNAGARPIGLGARDTLRLEAGMNLYGSEMDGNISPLECNMAWVVSLKDQNRNFIGKESFLKKKRKGDFFLLKGLLFEEKSIIRSHQKVYFDQEKKVTGIVTSGSYSPTLKKSIALARIPSINSKTCMTEIRGKVVKASVGLPRFVKEGRIIFKGNI